MYCEKYCFSEKRTKKHEKICEKSPVTFPCASLECTKTFKSEAVMRNHVRQYHRDLMAECNKRR